MSTLKDKLEKKSTSEQEETSLDTLPEEQDNSFEETISARDIQLPGVIDANTIGLDERALETKAALLKQPLLPIYIPLETGEKQGSQKYAAINGYPFWIQKGIMVNVPRDIHSLISNSIAESSAALRPQTDRKIG